MVTMCFTVEMMSHTHIKVPKLYLRSGVAALADVVDTSARSVLPQQNASTRSCGVKLVFSVILVLRSFVLMSSSSTK